MGRIVSEDVRKRTSETLKGRKHSKERISNMINNRIDFNHTKESKIKIGLNCPHRRPIVQIDKKSNKFIREWTSATEAQRELKIQHVSCACRGVRKVAGGFKWMFKTDYKS